MGQHNESPDSNSEAKPSTSQNRSFWMVFSVCKTVHRFLQNHLLSTLVIGIGLYVIFFVPQISNIWQQGPNRKNDFAIWLLFWGYVFVLAGYYVGAILIFTSNSPTLLSRIFFPVEWSLSWLSRLVRREKSASLGLAVVAAGSLLIFTGRYFQVFEGWYSLSEIYWESFLLWLLATLVWFAACRFWQHRWQPEPDAKLPDVLHLSARFLSCLLVGYVFGEIIWVLASFQVSVASYRNYAIWGVYQTLIFFILIARGADKLSRNSEFPVRMLTIAGMVGFFVYAQPWIHFDTRIIAHKYDLDTSDPHEHDAHEPIPLALEWPAHQHYDFLIKRIEQTEPYEPVVFVAASGGGSRATIFSALILEGLARERIAPGYPKTWADQIVMISSVSGGSLASAHFVHRGMRESFLEESGMLQSAIRTDLVHELPRAAQEVALFYAQDDSAKLVPDTIKSSELIRITAEIEKNSEEFFEQLSEHLENYPGRVSQGSEAGQLGWIIDARMIDEISLDFMAPLFRGATSMITPRGNALRDFWTDRFGWPSLRASNAALEGQASQESSSEVYPLVLFNATNVRTGSRLVASYAANDGGNPRIPGQEVALFLSDGYRADISLSQAVRLSSNFPFGFPATRIDLGGKIDVEIRNAASDVEILDGGIVDNTGIDTIHAFFKQLIHDYELHDSRGEKAQKLVSLLKERRIVLIEIDSGAKPEAQKDDSRDGIFAAFTVPLDALNNASYNNSEISKKGYLREINEIISRHLTQVEQYASVNSKPISSTPDIRFLCNYKAEPQAVMTAWALGPRDKASVIARFVLSWRKQQPRLSHLGKLYVEEKRVQDRLASLLKGMDEDAVNAVDQITKLDEQVTRLPDIATAARPQDISSIRNAIGAVQQSVQKLGPQSAPELEKIKSAGQQFINNAELDNSVEYVKSREELKEVITNQAQAIMHQKSFDRETLKKYQQQQEALNRLKSRQIELKHEFEKLEKIEALEQRKALNRIKQSKARD